MKRSSSLGLLLLGLGLGLGPGAVLSASPDDWRSRSIYQLVTDRFALGNNTSPECDTGARKYCGGSYQGIINKLDYIQSMGFDAVWISPIVENVQGSTVYGEAYHGYWPSNISSLNTNFGSADDLKSLGSALHQRGMYLMVDVVVNHLVANPTNTSSVWPETFDFSQLYPFNAQSDYHPQCFITDYNNQTDVEQCWLGDAGLPLLDLNTEDTNMVQTLNSWIKDLVSDYSVDGIRIDTVKHIRQDFWSDFASSAGVYTVGEVLTNNVSYASPYTRVLSGVLDYPTYYAAFNAFTSSSGNISAIADVVTQAQDSYQSGSFLLGSFVENHDQPRVQSVTSDQSLVKNAMAWVFVNDGIPIIYYGQEQGYQGGNDPSNREALWLSGFNTDNKPLVTHIKTLNEARKLAISSQSSFLTTKATFIPQSDTTTLAISKPPLLTLLTNGGNSSSAKWSIPSSAKLFGNSETVVDVLTCETMTTDSSGGLDVEANEGAPKVIVAAEKLNSSGTLCASQARSGGSGNGAVGMRGVGGGLVGGLVLMGLGMLLV